MTKTEIKVVKNKINVKPIELIEKYDLICEIGDKIIFFTEETLERVLESIIKMKIPRSKRLYFLRIIFSSCYEIFITKDGKLNLLKKENREHFVDGTKVIVIRKENCLILEEKK